jgi:hypothetical protein
MFDDFEWLDLEDPETDVLDEPTQEIKCECGAKHTTHDNIHSNWCPLYVPPMGE